MDSIRARLTELRANRSPMVERRKAAFNLYKVLSAGRLELPTISVILDQVTNNNSENKMNITTLVQAVQQLNKERSATRAGRPADVLKENDYIELSRVIFSRYGIKTDTKELGQLHDATATKLKDVKPGEYIKRAWNAKKVYTKQAYDRSAKRFRCDDESDISRCLYLRGEDVVYIGFDY